MNSNVTMTDPCGVVLCLIFELPERHESNLYSLLLAMSSDIDFNIKIDRMFHYRLPAVFYKVFCTVYTRSSNLGSFNHLWTLFRLLHSLLEGNLLKEN